MLRVTVLAVGKLKEPWLREAVAEYAKRTAAFCRLELVELAEGRLPQSPSQAEIGACLRQEGALILAKCPARAAVIALCIEGEQISSEGLGERISGLSGRYSHVVFVIGSSHGLDEAVKKRAVMRLSLSPMTFPHQLARVMLLEQVYRAFSIEAGTRYHK